MFVDEGPVSERAGVVSVPPMAKYVAVRKTAMSRTDPVIWSTSLATWGLLVYRSYVGMAEAKKDRRGLPFVQAMLGPRLSRSLWVLSAGGYGAWIGVLCAAGLLLGCDNYSDLRASLGPAEKAQFSRGQREATACWSCHDVTGSALKVGPPLGDMMGRRAGAVPGFPYSEALQGSDLVWTAQTLDAFLVTPQRVLPGNRMISPALREPQRRADLIFFLRQVTRSKTEPVAPHP